MFNDFCNLGIFDEFAIAVDCKSGKGLDAFKGTVKTTLAEKLEQYAKKGMVGKPLRVMVVGIPNVGKSTFINRIAGKTRAKAENRPGVTRGNQWFTIDKQLIRHHTPLDTHENLSLKPREWESKLTLQ